MPKLYTVKISFDYGTPITTLQYNRLLPATATADDIMKGI